ncbi:DUF3757 domain-containing protein [Chitinimonas sp. BJB300]|uniref:DUF3757 domain-containing protein n=1 Tax=Chitinimonas sp. BJB300 TaxID=1559339 RepID=UPI001E44CF15|nr:DUF3757 domain-containing protein [Chitinimonas sp. BJB300]
MDQLSHKAVMQFNSGFFPALAPGQAPTLKHQGQIRERDCNETVLSNKRDKESHSPATVDNQGLAPFFEMISFKHVKRLPVVAIAIVGFMSHATASVIACPTVSEITQSEGAYGGYAYTATAANGKQWLGENPMADQADLGKVRFNEAYILTAKQFVACDYVGKNGSGMRMALKTTSAARPIGALWVEQTQSKWHCAAPVRRARSSCVYI